MALRTQVYAIIALALAVWVGTLGLYGVPVDWAMLKPFGTTVGIVTSIGAFFERVAWKWPLVNGFLVRRPPLAGTWRAELLSSYVENGQRLKKVVFVVIHQSLLSLSIRVYTDKARSLSIAQSIRKSDVDDLYEIAIVYQNIPDIAHRQNKSDSQIHFGALHLTDVKPNAGTIAGPYWTDRGTNGDITLLERKKGARITSYQEGLGLFGLKA